MKKVSRRDFLKIIFSLVCYPAIKPIVERVCVPSIYWNGSRQIPAIAITFDDCYGHEYLRKLEDLLDTYSDIKVTFFPTGTGLLHQTTRDSKIWSRLLSKGHEIGYHSYSHTQPSSLSMKDTSHEFSQWKNTLSNTLGSDPVIKFARPPFGDLSRNFYNLCYLQNLAIIMWSQNWSLVHKTKFLELSTTQNGDIVLFHIREQDIKNFEDCIPKVYDMGLKMVNLTTLLYENEQNQDGKAIESKKNENLCSSNLEESKTCVR